MRVCLVRLWPELLSRLVSFRLGIVRKFESRCSGLGSDRTVSPLSVQAAEHSGLQRPAQHHQRAPGVLRELRCDASCCCLLVRSWLTLCSHLNRPFPSLFGCVCVCCLISDAERVDDSERLPFAGIGTAAALSLSCAFGIRLQPVRLLGVRHCFPILSYERHSLGLCWIP